MTARLHAFTDFAPSSMNHRQILNAVAASVILASQLAAMAGFASCPIPDEADLFSGIPVGLADEKGRPVIPAKYSRIEYLGNGIFFATGVSEDRFVEGRDKHLFNRDGKELEVVLPKDSQFVDIAWLGEAAESDSSMNLDGLQPDALIRFIQNGKVGLCHPDGTVFLAPGNYSVEHVGGGKAFLQKFRPLPKLDTVFSIIDLKTGDITPVKSDLNYTWISPFSDGFAAINSATGRKFLGFLKPDGELLVKKDYLYATSFHNGVSLVTIRSSNGKESRIKVNKTFAALPAKVEVGQFQGDSGQYEVLTPIYENQWTNNAATINQTVAPIAYFAKRFNSDDCLAISPTGEELFVFPRGKMPPSQNNAPPVMINGFVRYLFRDVATDQFRYAYLDMHGREVPDSERLPAVSGMTFYDWTPGRYRFSVTNADDGHFDPQYWANHHTNRIKWFGRFLKDYNLIGMSRVNVLSLLSKNVTSPNYKSGAQDIIYWLDHHLSLKIFFRNDRVYQWCLVQSNQELAPYVTNVVLCESDSQRFNRAAQPSFVPKH